MNVTALEELSVSTGFDGNFSPHALAPSDSLQQQSMTADGGVVNTVQFSSAAGGDMRLPMSSLENGQHTCSVSRDNVLMAASKPPQSISPGESMDKTPSSTVVTAYTIPGSGASTIPQTGPTFTWCANANGGLQQKHVSYNPTSLSPASNGLPSNSSGMAPGGCSAGAGGCPENGIASVVPNPQGRILTARVPPQQQGYMYSPVTSLQQQQQQQQFSAVSSASPSASTAAMYSSLSINTGMDSISSMHPGQYHGQRGSVYGVGSSVSPSSPSDYYDHQQQQQSLAAVADPRYSLSTYHPPHGFPAEHLSPAMGLGSPGNCIVPSGGSLTGGMGAGGYSPSGGSMLAAPQQISTASYHPSHRYSYPTGCGPQIAAANTDLSRSFNSLSLEERLYNGQAQMGTPYLSNGHLIGNRDVYDQDNGLSAFSPCQDGSGEQFSRKVFVGGLPPDIDEDEIRHSFSDFGPLSVDWPHKTESKSYFPPKGYAFLIFKNEASVQQLIDSCVRDEDKYYMTVSSPTIKDKAVQIRPWRLADADFVLDASLPLDARKTVFVGGVPRPLKAVELATILDRLYEGVCYAGIDTDPELRYPKGAGRVAFSKQESYIAAICARFVHLKQGDIDKRVEVKPYVLDDQMCDECQGQRCNGKYAPFFCSNITCLQYYCESCWTLIHSAQGREFHKPLVKEGADRNRVAGYRWM